MLFSRTSQFSAMAARVANSTAVRFNTGSAPGRPRQTGQTLLLGCAPNLVEQPQNALVSVNSWTWTSRPMTTSYLAWMADFSAVDMNKDYSQSRPTSSAQPCHNSCV